MPNRHPRSDDAAANRAVIEHLHLQRSVDGLAQLAGQIAHDFNNVMAVALTSAEMTGAMTHDAKAKRFIAAAINAIRNGRELTDALASIAPSCFVPERVAVHALIEALHGLLAARLGAHALRVQLKAERDVVETDRRMLAVALLNLVANAGEAMAQSGECILATHNHNGQSSHDRDRTYLTISVRDHGTGMSDEVRQRAGELFFSTKSPDRGIGLAQVRDTVRRTNGIFTIESVAGEGTTVKLSLPLAR